MGSNFRFQVILSFVILAIVSTGVWAEQVIRDEFYVPGAWDVLNIPGTSPSVTNLPGGVWQEAHGWDWAEPRTRGTGYGGTPSAAVLQDDTGLAVSLASSGSYTKPEQMTISADVAITAGEPGVGSVALGFYADPPPPADRAGTGVNERTNFTGLLLSDDGSLQLIEYGTLIGTALDGPDLDRDTFYNLSYEVDTTDGSIENVQLDGNPFNFTSVAFTDAATMFAAFLASGGQNTDGAVDNFTIESIETVAVPEPASMIVWTLLGLGLMIGIHGKKR